MPEVRKEYMPADAWSLFTDTDVSGAFVLQCTEEREILVRRGTDTEPTGLDGALSVRAGDPMLGASLDALFPGVAGQRIWVYPKSFAATVSGSYA